MNYNKLVLFFVAAFIIWEIVTDLHWKIGFCRNQRQNLSTKHTGAVSLWQGWKSRALRSPAFHHKYFNIIQSLVKKEINSHLVVHLGLSEPTVGLRI